ncbi:hypothetical protein AMTR_s00056p00101160 [Amborella trichopoda]|uniref:Uncharacterized protein n=1 Tax=Amborella trichopoda TaxID=13333 RepID=U5CY90_AMBTC|nr:hypothetical protein AMTR_s00056p00101160 [Amborella trichopoda]
MKVIARREMRKKSLRRKMRKARLRREMMKGESRRRTRSQRDGDVQANVKGNGITNWAKKWLRRRK